MTEADARELRRLKGWLEYVVQTALDWLDAIEGDPDFEAACDDDGIQCDDEGSRSHGRGPTHDAHAPFDSYRGSGFDRQQTGREILAFEVN